MRTVAEWAHADDTRVDAVQLRRWDDLAKTPSQATPPLGYYLALLGNLADR